MNMLCLLLTYAVMIGSVSASLTAMTRSKDGRLWWPIIVPAVLAHGVFMYVYGAKTAVSTENWWQLYFLALALLVALLAFCLSDGSRGRTAFLVLAYFAYGAILVPVGNLFFSGACLSLSSKGRLLACWPVALLGNLAFVFLVPRRALRCDSHRRWGLPCLSVGLLLALLVASGTWPVSLAAATGRSTYLVFALAVLATIASTIAFCQPKQNRSYYAEEDVKDEEPKVSKVNKQQENELQDNERQTNKERTNSPASPQAPCNESSSARDCGSPEAPVAPTKATPSAGEDLFIRARAMPHNEIPDMAGDGLYLELLSQSAEEGYAPALAKLGEYAMRRGAWVEAYYWFSKAKRNGLRNLETPMREVRRTWVDEGLPDQLENVHELFTEDAGSIGRALLHLDSGHASAQARAFLKEYHPEFLTGKTNHEKC